MMRRHRLERKCRIALIAIAGRYSANLTQKKNWLRSTKRRCQILWFMWVHASSLYARRDGGDHHRCHLELFVAVDDAVPCGDPRKIGINCPDCTQRFLRSPGD